MPIESTACSRALPGVYGVAGGTTTPGVGGAGTPWDVSLPLARKSPGEPGPAVAGVRYGLCSSNQKLTRYGCDAVMALPGSFGAFVIWAYASLITSRDSS